MKQLLLGLALSLGVVGAAAAADFVVVSSSDPAIVRGREVASGEQLSIAAGKSVVLVDTAGQVVRLSGSPATAPRRQYASLNDDRVAVLKLLVSPPRVRRAGPNLEKTCPATDLTKFDGIVETAKVDGCLAAARTAFDAYVLKAAGPEAP